MHASQGTTVMAHSNFLQNEIRIFESIEPSFGEMYHRLFHVIPVVYQFISSISSLFPSFLTTIEIILIYLRHNSLLRATAGHLSKKIRAGIAGTIPPCKAITFKTMEI
jgi:hypothetical protein